MSSMSSSSNGINTAFNDSIKCDESKSNVDECDVRMTRAPSHSQIMANIMRRNGSAFDLSSIGVSNPSNIDQKMLHMRMEDELLKSITHSKVFHLRDVLPMIAEGANIIVEDDFHKCFELNPPEPWNWNAYLYVFWSIGVFWRYAVLFPLRLFSLALGFIIAAVSYIVGMIVGTDQALLKRKIIMNLASAFVFSWTGVIKYHGVIPKRKPNQIYVANHTSMIDVLVLMQNNSYAVVGQQHKSWVAWFQNHVLDGLGCIWFDRGEAKDRKLVSERIKNVIANPTSNRLLIFPEGVCVNNEYCVQFKKGAFDLGAEICPIAIKYNKQFVDAFWNSKRPFHWHLFDIMTSWALVCDVWYLPPQTQHPAETSIEFANRVKMMISKQARLIPVDYNGMLKHWTGPSGRFLCNRQQLIANSLLERERVFRAEQNIQKQTVSPNQEPEIHQRHSFQPI